MAQQGGGHGGDRRKARELRDCRAGLVRSAEKGDRYRPDQQRAGRSEEHTSELQSLMRISYAVFCLKKKKQMSQHITNKHTSLSIQRQLSNTYKSQHT